jgi:hypothetical protein
MLRLELPGDIRGFHLWDLADPPNLGDCDVYGRTVNLRDATGLTFFFAFDKVYAVHAHTPSQRSAEKTFERLPQRNHADVVWVYLPLPKNEDIVAFGLRLKLLDRNVTVQKPCFLVIASLAACAKSSTKTSSSVQVWLAISRLDRITQRKPRTYI